MVRCRRVATASVSETAATAQARSTAACATSVASNQRNATPGRPQRRDRRRLTGRRTARPRPSRYRFRVDSESPGWGRRCAEQTRARRRLGVTGNASARAPGAGTGATNGASSVRSHRRVGQQVLSWRDDVRRVGQPRPRRVDPDHPRGARRRDQLHRHGRRLWPGRVRGDRRQGARRRPPRRRDPRHEVPQRDG